MYFTLDGGTGSHYNFVLLGFSQSVIMAVTAVVDAVNRLRPIVFLLFIAAAPAMSLLMSPLQTYAVGMTLTPTPPLFDGA